MKLSYAITVCNESKDLYSLISFLKRVKDEEDEINVLVDTKQEQNTAIASTTLIKMYLSIASMKLLEFQQKK